MAMASSSADPSQFAVAVGIGYAHVLDRVLTFLERTSALTSPVVAVSLAIPALLAYLVVVTIAFVVRVAADSYVHIVASGCGGDDDDDGLVGKDLALSPAAVLGWLVGLVVKPAGSLVLFSVLSIALLRFSSVPCSPLAGGKTDL